MVLERVAKDLAHKLDGIGIAPAHLVGDRLLHVVARLRRPFLELVELDATPRRRHRAVLGVHGVDDLPLCARDLRRVRHTEVPEADVRALGGVVGDEEFVGVLVAIEVAVLVGIGVFVNVTVGVEVYVTVAVGVKV